MEALPEKQPISFRSLSRCILLRMQPGKFFAQQRFGR
jgi:hypothetical protein